ncbi:MAG: phosphate acyltransferase PlsX [Lachnospiraceae bacterium]|nr:phosphate acyltransferase PlsX [Lachnospiraceae bacterium]
MVSVVVDAMGGDNAPEAPIKGALNALNKRNDIKVIFVGKEDVIKGVLAKNTYDKDRVEIVDAPEVIETGEPPVMAIRKKKESSIVKGLYLVKDKKADAFISSGSSGAILVGGQVIVGRLKGVERPPLAPIIPTENGIACLIDCGANVDARASHLVQFAKMGSIYMENVLGISNPRVAIVNIGEEEEKGNMLVKETFPLLRNCPDINFIGSIEARDIPLGKADVIVCEAFVGNVILKFYEGVGITLKKVLKKALMSGLKTKIGALFIKNDLKEQMKRFDASEYGGAPLLGLNGLVVKAHGSAKEKEISIAVEQCAIFKEQKINEKINEKINVLYQEGI